MTELTWDATGDRNFTSGVDRGVFYPQNGVGVPWNGLVTVKETVDNAGQLATYVDGQKQVNQLNLGDFAATIDAITYPDEFLPYDGYTDATFSGQARPLFNLSYRTLNGNDISGLDLGYRLHLVYNCLAKPSQRNNVSLNAGSDISAFSWDLSTTPLPVQDFRATAHFIIDTATVLPGMLSAIEGYLYGTDTTDPLFPTVDALLGLFEANALYIVVDNGDGSWTATGPDEAFDIVGTEFTLDWPWVDYLDSNTYLIKSF